MVSLTLFKFIRIVCLAMSLTQGTMMILPFQNTANNTRCRRSCRPCFQLPLLLALCSDSWIFCSSEKNITTLGIKQNNLISKQFSYQLNMFKSTIYHQHKVSEITSTLQI